jgi:hypothetical protein
MMAMALLHATGVAGGFALSRLEADNLPDHADLAGKTLTGIS